MFSDVNVPADECVSSKTCALKKRPNYTPVLSSEFSDIKYRSEMRQASVRANDKSTLRDHLLLVDGLQGGAVFRNFNTDNNGPFYENANWNGENRKAITNCPEQELGCLSSQ